MKEETFACRRVLTGKECGEYFREKEQLEERCKVPKESLEIKQ